MTNPDSNASSLPKFAVNVINPNQIELAQLKAMLETFDAGSSEPLILGGGGRPQAALIPFRDYVRLLKHDHLAKTVAHEHEELAFATEVAARVRNTDAARAADDISDDAQEVDLVDLVEELGEPARSILARELGHE